MNHEMKADNYFSRIQFGGPAIYQISVLGKLSEAWRHRLNHLDFEYQFSNAGCTTVMKGKIQDQSELNGIISNLIDYKHILLSVQKLYGD